MKCEKCGNQMGMGAPHCETIKVQYECGSCGNIECEYYTPEEQKVNELCAATGANLKDCRNALEETDYNPTQADILLNDKQNSAQLAGRLIKQNNGEIRLIGGDGDFYTQVSYKQLKSIVKERNQYLIALNKIAGYAMKFSSEEEPSFRGYFEILDQLEAVKIVEATESEGKKNVLQSGESR